MTDSNKSNLEMAPNLRLPAQCKICGFGAILCTGALYIRIVVKIWSVILTKLNFRRSYEI